MQKQDIRCGECGRKLGEGIVFSLSVRCPRCKTLNHFRPAGHEPPDQNAAERPRGEPARGSQ